MLDQNKYIDQFDYTIIEKPSFFSVDKRIADIISILNQKGYYTDYCNVCNLGKIAKHIILIEELNNNNIIENINNQKLYEIIDRICSESLSVTFKEKYNLTPPQGFYLLDKHLFSHLSPINKENFNFKEVKEMEIELKNKISDLKEWANSLPNIKGVT